jgi:hypothetical protein
MQRRHLTIEERSEVTAVGMPSRSGATHVIALVLTALAFVTASVAVGQDPPPCPQQGFVPQLMTPPAEYLPGSGGLVVGLVPGGSDASGTLPALSLTQRRRTVTLRSEPIAPGLFRLRADTQRLRGSYALSGLPGAPQLTFRRGALPPPPVAPGLERAERYLVASGDARRLEVRAHFAFPLPPDVVAVVSAWGEDDAPDAWVRSSPTQRTLVLFTVDARDGRGECDAAPEGASRPPEAGGTVRVAFVDRHGQVSPLSEPRPIE